MKLHKRVLIAMSLALALGSTGCYGQFSLSKKLHSWNGQASDNKFVNSLLFVGLVIVPVYEISLIVDTLVFNPIEFWTGSNPAGSGSAAQVSQQGRDRVAVRNGDVEVRLVPGAGGAIDVYAGDVKVGVATHAADGSLVVRDALGAELRRVSPTELAAVQAKSAPDAPSAP